MFLRYVVKGAVVGRDYDGGVETLAFGSFSPATIYPRYS
jgi:hypothetical protein